MKMTKDGVYSLVQKIRVLSWKIKIGIILLVLAIGWFGIRPLLVTSQQTEVQYQTATVERDTLITSVSGSGTISSANSSSITSSATGVVVEVYVQNGDTVSAGDPIAQVTLDQNALQQQAQAYASYLSAQNMLNAAKSKMNSLQANLFQASEDFTGGAGSDNPDTNDPQYIIEKATWLQAEADYTNQANVIKQAEAALISASLAYAELSATITAPVSGTITNLSISPGVSLSSQSTQNTSSSTASSSESNTASQSIGSITAEDGTLQASVNLSEIDITKVELDQKVTMELDAFPDKTFTGKVTAINTSGTTSSGVTTYPVTITFDSALEKMYPNMAVSATIITTIANDVLLVPLNAVQTTDGQSSVRMMRNGQITNVTVETGDTNDTQVEILSGLNEGDTVITGQTGGQMQGAQQTTSPFGGSGFGGGGGRNAPAGGVMIQR